MAVSNYGVTTVLYGPEMGTAREDAAISVAKALEAEGHTISGDTYLPFSDQNEISSENRVYVAAVLDWGVIGGFEDNTFRADDTLTRAEAAAILYRAVMID